MKNYQRRPVTGLQASFAPTAINLHFAAPIAKGFERCFVNHRDAMVRRTMSKVNWTGENREVSKKVLRSKHSSFWFDVQQAFRIIGDTRSDVTWLYYRYVRFAEFLDWQARGFEDEDAELSRRLCEEDDDISF